MEDCAIEQNINNLLLDTSFILMSFQRNHGCFGNMIAVIIDLKKKKTYRFTSDRGDIYCDMELIFTSDYHIAGEDDSVIYLLKAIKQLVIDSSEV